MTVLEEMVLGCHQHYNFLEDYGKKTIVPFKKSPVFDMKDPAGYPLWEPEVSVNCSVPITLTIVVTANRRTWYFA